MNRTATSVDEARGRGRAGSEATVGRTARSFGVAARPRSSAAAPGCCTSLLNITVPSDPRIEPWLGRPMALVRESDAIDQPFEDLWFRYVGA